MPSPNTITHQTDERLLPAPRQASARRQQRLMMISLALLLGALFSILYRDREFWFPNTEQAEQAADTAAEQKEIASAATAATPSVVRTKPSKAQSKRAMPELPVADPPPAPIVIGKRTVLPPLEVEVVAGDAHQTVHPGSNSVKVDLQSRPTNRASAQPRIEIQTEPPVVPTSAAERGRVSTVSTSVVTSVRPDYPMLARQMKVEGSVILQALIGRDGLIQDLQVVSGPPILATAAREAVRQWHFKPHYLGDQTVETETRITVNFTISTN
jgi:TonB family protein